MVGEVYVWYLLATSVSLNFITLSTLFKRKRQMASVRSGVELSREELEALKRRLTRIKNL